jgi:hypothetical protein
VIIIPSDLLNIGAKAINIKLQQWAEDENISEEKWDELYDVVEANFSRLQWICQLAREKLLSIDFDKDEISNSMFFGLLKRDFEWDWSCEIDVLNYWPFGLSYKTEEILNK